MGDSESTIAMRPQDSLRSAPHGGVLRAARLAPIAVVWISGGLFALYIFARYIGAIGSRKTNENRFAALRAEGFTDDQLSLVHGPVGLDLGGRGAEETALGILAEITAVRFGGSGSFMREARRPSVA